MSTIGAVRAQIAAQLLATTTLVRESAEPVELMRTATHSPVHLEFGVGSSAESYTARNQQERTVIEVVIPYQLQGKSRISGTTGVDSLYTLERTVLAALQISDWGALGPRLAALCNFDSRRELGIDGWIWLVVTCTALHSTL